MSFHLAYPTTADLDREADAEDRDVADLVALRDLRGIVADAIARAGRIDRIQHPDRRWTTADLLEVLQDELANISRIRFFTREIRSRQRSHGGS